MRAVLLALACLCVAEGTIKITWSDCGASVGAHCTVTDVKPLSVEEGSPQVVTGTGTCDESATGGQYTFKVKAGWVTLLDHTGDMCKSETMDLPFGLGSVSWGGLACPHAAGPVAVPITLSLSKNIPESLAHTTMSATAVASSGDQLLCLSTTTAPAAVSSELRGEFINFVNKYGRGYHGEEYARRFETFAKNFAYYKQENAKNLPYRLAINEFSDMTPEEFAKTHFGLIAPSPEKMWAGAPYLGRHEYHGEKLADAVDWTTQGAVTAVKNQGQCGSCWTFSSTGALEGAFKIAGGALVSMSEQQLVDCCKLGGCNGCSGGLMDYAFQYLRNHVVCTEASYGYTAKDGSCHDSSCDGAVASGGVTGYKDVTKDDTNALLSAVSQQPVAIAIEADQSSFQGYSGGVLTKACGSQLDHGVLLVGYGTDGGTDYWKVKNSWGGSWGESGYIRLERGIAGAGECGLKASASYPHVDNKPGPPGPSPSPSPSSNCAAAALEFCCSLGTPCDCSKGSDASGQCGWMSYDYCCNTGTPCTCSESITV